MFKKLLLASALLVTFASAQAQSSQPFGVTGTVTPTPCNVTMSSGGTNNYGSISTATVKGWPISSPTTTAANASYGSSIVNVPFSITCSAATKIGISMTDNNPGKIISEDASDPVRFGLVNGAGTSSIGHFRFYFGNVVLDGATTGGGFISAPTGSTTWSATSAAGTPRFTYWAAPGNTNAFVKVSGATVPDAFTTISGNLAMFIALNKSIVDSATTAITFSGSGTLTLAYL